MNLPEHRCCSCAWATSAARQRLKAYFDTLSSKRVLLLMSVLIQRVLMRTTSMSRQTVEPLQRPSGAATHWTVFAQDA
jgi:hypothetical protein